MGTPTGPPLREGLRALEARLQRRWAAHAGGAPPGLRAYRAGWLADFRDAWTPTEAPAVLQACARADPLLVSDFHPLARSGRMLGRLLLELPSERPPCVVLELLPEHPPAPLREHLRGRGARLVDGRPLASAMPELLDALAARDALLAGAWIDGGPAARDRAAADAWAARRAADPDGRELLFFGDWHLADAHLPRALRERGARPVTLHQSPEPLWGRVDPAREHYLQRGADAYAWMHTPPLAYWSSACQREDRALEPTTLETAALLIEDLAAGLADLLGVPRPVDMPVVLGPEDWPGFRRALPRSERAAFREDQPPRMLLTHPHEALCWTPAPPSWNQLVEAAADALSRAAGPGAGADHAPRTAFRRTWARLWNPFLPARSADELAALAGPAAAGSAWLREEARGEAAAAVLRAHPLLDRASMRELLADGSRAFIWYLAVSTIAASSVSA